jgi:hypothetical protein
VTAAHVGGGNIATVWARNRAGYCASWVWNVGSGNLGIVALSAALAGCASSAADITPAYVSRAEYAPAFLGRKRIRSNVIPDPAETAKLITSEATLVAR